MNEETDLDLGASSPWQDIPESLNMRAKARSASSAETQDRKVHCHHVPRFPLRRGGAVLGQLLPPQVLVVSVSVVH